MVASSDGSSDGKQSEVALIRRDKAHVLTKVFSSMGQHSNSHDQSTGLKITLLQEALTRNQ
jgi:hypothetical protein